MPKVMCYTVNELSLGKPVIESDKMREVDVEKAKAELSDLIAEAVTGEAILISENGHKVMLVPVVTSPDERIPGSAKGIFVMSDDFDEPLEDFEEYMP